MRTEFNMCKCLSVFFAALGSGSRERSHYLQNPKWRPSGIFCITTGVSNRMQKKVSYLFICGVFEAVFVKISAQTVCMCAPGWEQPKLYHFRSQPPPRALHKWSPTCTYSYRLWRFLLYLFIYCSLKMYFLFWRMILSASPEGGWDGETKVWWNGCKRRGRIIRTEKRGKQRARGLARRT